MMYQSRCSDHHDHSMPLVQVFLLMAKAALTLHDWPLCLVTFINQVNEDNKVASDNCKELIFHLNELVLCGHRPSVSALEPGVPVYPAKRSIGTKPLQMFTEKGKH